MPHPELAYFEDCTQIVASLRLGDDERTRLQKAPEGTFTPIGIGHIAALDLDMALGIRKRPGGHLQERVARGLVAAGMLLDHKPTLQDIVPLFSAVVLDEQGQEVGTLTQDFSDKGSLSLRKELFGIPTMGPIPKPTSLHALVYEALGAANIDRDAYGRISAVTPDWEPTRYFVDYQTLLRPECIREQVGVIIGRIDQLTISSS